MILHCWLMKRLWSFDAHLWKQIPPSEKILLGRCIISAYISASLGRYEDAVRADEEAVELRRMLVEADPTVREDLAWSLYNLGVYLSKLGRYEDAVRADEEAVELVTLWWKQIQPSEKILHDEEALEVRRKLMETDPTIRKDLAPSLVNLGVHLSNLGRYKDAVHADEEAVELYRKLSETDPTIRKTLLIPYEEAVELYRKLSETDPTIRKDLLIACMKSGRYEHALCADEEVVNLRRKLVEMDPTVMQSLGYSLENLGLSLSAMGHQEAAIVAGEEAVDICSKLPRPNVESELSLANRLKQLATYLDAVDRHEDALRSREKGAEIHHRLGETDPELTADSFHDLASDFRSIGRHEDALRAEEKAVDLYRRVTQTAPKPTLFRFCIESMESLAGDMRTLGREDDAVRIDAEVATLKNRLEEGQGPITGAVESSRLLVIPEIAGEGAETGGASEVDQGNNEGTLSEPPVSEEVQFAWWSEKYDRKLIAHMLESMRSKFVKQKAEDSDFRVYSEPPRPRPRRTRRTRGHQLPEAAAGMGTGAGMSLKTLTSPGAKSRRRLPRPSRMQAVWVSDGEDEDDATVTSDNGEPKEDDADEEDADARAIAVPSLEGLDDLDGAPETERVVRLEGERTLFKADSRRRRIHLARRDGEYVLNRFGNNAAATAGADADADAVGGKVADYAALPVAGAEVPVSGSVFGSSLATENAAPIFTSMGSPALLVYASDIPRILADCITGHLISCCGPALDLASQTTVAAHYRICPVPRARDCPVW
ncbi:hypothetical protein B0H11DRAFT_2199400 [Mycena galericulata]|nr:hypothetical protein B0H11DRAFT_2199400 [Mycena galericulata]